MSEKLLNLRHKLEKKQQQGEKTVLWSLNRQQKEYLERWGYKPIPALYCIKISGVSKIGKTDSILIKEMKSRKKRGSKELYRNLTQHDRDILDKYGIEYAVHKYSINTTPTT